jgi:hypothetical protein
MEDNRIVSNVHPSAFEVLKNLGTYKKIRKYLKSFGCTKGEQTMIIRQYKASDPNLKIK